MPLKEWMAEQKIRDDPRLRAAAAAAAAARRAELQRTATGITAVRVNLQQAAHKVVSLRRLKREELVRPMTAPANAVRNLADTVRSLLFGAPPDPSKAQTRSLSRLLEIMKDPKTTRKGGTHVEWTGPDAPPDSPRKKNDVEDLRASPPPVKMRKSRRSKKMTAEAKKAEAARVRMKRALARRQRTKKKWDGPSLLQRSRVAAFESGREKLVKSRGRHGFKGYKKRRQNKHDTKGFLVPDANNADKVQLDAPEGGKRGQRRVIPKRPRNKKITFDGSHIFSTVQAAEEWFAKTQRAERRRREAIANFKPLPNIDPLFVVRFEEGLERNAELPFRRIRGLGRPGGSGGREPVAQHALFSGISNELVARHVEAYEAFHRLMEEAKVEAKAEDPVALDSFRTHDGADGPVNRRSLFFLLALAFAMVRRFHVSCGDAGGSPRASQSPTSMSSPPSSPIFRRVSFRSSSPPLSPSRRSSSPAMMLGGATASPVPLGGDKVPQKGHLRGDGSELFSDLTSAGGQLAAAAAMLHPFKTCRGFEENKFLHRFASNVRHRYRTAATLAKVRGGLAREHVASGDATPTRSWSGLGRALRFDGGSPTNTGLKGRRGSTGGFQHPRPQPSGMRIHSRGEKDGGCGLFRCRQLTVHSSSGPTPSRSLAPLHVQTADLELTSPTPKLGSPSSSSLPSLAGKSCGQSLWLAPASVLHLAPAPSALQFYASGPSERQRRPTSRRGKVPGWYESDVVLVQEWLLDVHILLRERAFHQLQPGALLFIMMRRPASKSRLLPELLNGAIKTATTGDDGKEKEAEEKGKSGEEKGKDEDRVEEEAKPNEKEGAPSDKAKDAASKTEATDDTLVVATQPTPFEMLERELCTAHIGLGQPLAVERENTHELGWSRVTITVLRRLVEERPRSPMSPGNASTTSNL